MADVDLLADRHERLAARHPEFGRPKNDAGVVVVADPHYIGTFSGQVTWATLLNITARLYKGIRHIRLVLPPDVSRLPHVFFANPLDNLREASLEFLQQLNHQAFTIDEGVPPAGAQGEWIWVYVGAYDSRLPAGIRVAGQGWVACVNDDSWQRLASVENPIGPMVAACFGAAEIYKALYPLRQHNAQASIIFSAFDYSRNLESNPELPNRFHLPRTYVAGAGAVGMALLLLLDGTPAIHSGSGLYVVDDDVLDDTNMNRCLLAALSDIDSLKTTVLESRLDVDRLALKFYPAKWESFVQAPEHSDPLNYERVVSCVDKYPARRAVQYDQIPKVLLTAGTGDFLLSVSRHVLDDGLSCGLCYQAREGDEGCATASQDAQQAFSVPIDPSIGFVSALAGFLLAAEFLKEVVPALHAGRVKNTVRAQLLTGTTKVSARNKDDACNCSSEFVAIGYRSIWKSAVRQQQSSTRNRAASSD